MSKQSPRLLNYKEITTIKRALDITKPLLSAEEFKTFLDYVNTALEENISGKLLTHQNESWVNGPSMRNGASSVMGTVYEFLCVALLRSEWVELEPSFVFDKDEQALLNIDLYINFVGKCNTAQVKEAIYKINDRKNIRLGNDYFVNTKDELAFADYLLLGSIKDGCGCCYVLPHRAAYGYFQKHKIAEHDNQYCYVPVTDLLKETGGMVLQNDK